MWSFLKTVLKRVLRCKKDSLLLFYWRSGGGGGGGGGGRCSSSSSDGGISGGGSCSSSSGGGGGRGGCGGVKHCLFLKVQNTRKMSSFVNRLYRKIFKHKAEEIRRAMHL